MIKIKNKSVNYTKKKTYISIIKKKIQLTHYNIKLKL